MKSFGYLLLSCLLFLLSGCYHYVHHMSLQDPSSKEGYILGHIHVSSEIMAYPRSNTSLVLRNNKNDRIRIVCPINEKSNYICYYFVRLPVGKYKIERIEYDSNEMNIKTIRSASPKVTFRVRSKKIMYLEGYSLALTKEKDQKKVIVQKSDNLINTLDYFQKIKHLDLLDNYPIHYNQSKQAVIGTNSKGIPFNTAMQLTLYQESVQKVVMLIKNIEKKTKYQLIVKDISEPFFFNLAPGKYQIHSIFTPKTGIMWNYPDIYQFEVTSNQVNLLGNHHFRLEDNATMNFYSKTNDDLIQAVLDREGFLGVWLKTSKGIYCRGLENKNERANVVGYFSVNKPELKKLTLSINQLDGDSKYRAFINLFAQPYMIFLPNGRYQLQAVSTHNNRNKWLLHRGGAKQEAEFDVVNGKMSFLGNLKLSILSKNILSYEITKDKQELSRVKEVVGNRPLVLK